MPRLQARDPVLGGNASSALCGVHVDDSGVSSVHSEVAWPCEAPIKKAPDTYAEGLASPSPDMLMSVEK